MKVIYCDREEWKVYSENAHLIVFNEAKKAETDRIDFALLAVNDNEVPMTYVTCQERDSETLYWQYGGSFPGTKGTVLSLRTVQAFEQWCKDRGYRRVTFLVQNDNEAMMKMAMRCGFLVIGVRNYKGNILLEHLKEFE